MKKFRGLGVLLAFILPFSQTAMAAEELSSIEQWNQSSFKVETTASLITDKNCKTIALAYVGCFAALNAVLMEAKTQILKAPGGAQEPYYGKKLQQFGSWEVYEYLPKNVPAIKNQKELFERYQYDKNYQQVLADSLVNDFNKPSIDEVANYTFKDIPTNKLKYYAAKAFNIFIRSASDSHMELMTAQEYSNMFSEKTVEYFGIGVYISADPSNPKIISVMPNGPAREAGIKKDDILVQIDNVDVTPETASAQIDKIPGPKDTEVDITVLRNENRIRFKIKRQPFKIENIMTNIETAQNGKKILHIEVRDFMDLNLCHKFTTKIIDALANEKVDNIIVDLRNNTGGSLDEALCMAATFLPPGSGLLSTWNVQTKDFYVNYFLGTKGVVKRERNVRTNNVVFQEIFNYVKTTPYLYEILKGKPIVILVNEASASASEVFTGILQDQKVAAVIGVRTFGKGCVQSILPAFESLDLQIKLTVSRFHLPSGRSNHKVGISPDFEVFQDQTDKDNAPYALREVELAPLSPSAVEYPIAHINKDIKDQLVSCPALINASNIIDPNSADTGFDDQQIIHAVEAATCF